ncbi:hypothetical protein pCS0024 (plasmid) [Clavibacter sepedonicus]|uniref:Uncharacterized protein n=1 Tax=Clavibacter sepedonicus TaxID=31964 RepID=B0RJ19_CLASE|nr:hypothetical protein pCS0024 [Clavibacter sepedonicus]
MRFNRSPVDGDDLDLAEGGERFGGPHPVLHDGAADDVGFPQRTLYGAR